MITLLTFAPSFGLPAASPFAVKAIWLLNMSGQPWERENLADPRSMPHQKLPALRVGDKIIPDSDNIRDYLEQQGADFEPGLTDMDKANARAFVRMAEEHLYFHVVLDRWGDDSVWPMIRDTYFQVIPKLIRGMVTGQLRKKLLKGMHAQGLGRLSPKERLARVEPDLQAITTRLQQHPFLFAEYPTAADASVAAMLANMRSTPGTTLLKSRITQDEILCRYIDRAADAMGKSLSAGSVKLCA